MNIAIIFYIMTKTIKISLIYHFHIV